MSADVELEEVSVRFGPFLAVDRASVETNMVYIDVAGTGRGAGDLVAALKDSGIVMGALGPMSIRAVTHLDVDRVDEIPVLKAYPG